MKTVTREARDTITEERDTTREAKAITMEARDITTKVIITISLKCFASVLNDVENRCNNALVHKSMD